MKAENGLIIRDSDRNSLTCIVCGGELTFGEGKYHSEYRILCCNKSYIILPETYKVLALALNEFNIGQEIKANTLEVIEDNEEPEQSQEDEQVNE